jgi:hypothetical protein
LPKASRIIPGVGRVQVYRRCLPVEYQIELSSAGTFTTVQRYSSACPFVRLFGNTDREIIKWIGSLLTPERQEKLTIPTRSLVVCPIRVPRLPGVIYSCPGPLGTVLYPGVGIVEAENSGHPDDQGNPGERLETKGGFKIEESSCDVTAAEENASTSNGFCLCLCATAPEEDQSCGFLFPRGDGDEETKLDLNGQCRKACRATLVLCISS